MNIGLTARGKVRDMETALSGRTPEDLNANLDALFQDMASSIAVLNDYEIDLAADVTGLLPLANLTGATSGLILTANGAGLAPSYQSPAGDFVPIPIGTAAIGKRVAWWQRATNAASSAMAAVGSAAATITGGTNVVDADGFWGRPTTAGGGTAVFVSDPFTQTELLPEIKFRMRTQSSLADTRLYVGLSETGTAIVTDTPSTTTQEGIYLRYSTVAGDTGWVAVTIGQGGQTTSTTILAIAVSTIYLISITVISTTEVLFNINGTTHTATANIPTGADLRAFISLDNTAAGVSSFDLSTVYLTSR